MFMVFSFVMKLNDAAVFNVFFSEHEFTFI